MTEKNGVKLDVEFLSHLAAKIDLKIQKANLSKLILDLEIKELTGEMSLEEVNEKKKKLENLEVKINLQIQDIQNLLNL